MKKAEFIEQVATKAATTKAAAARIVDAIFDTTSGAIAEAVRAGNQVAIPGFGRFRARNRPARKGRNPRTGAEIDIPERMVVAFSPGKGLQDALKGQGGSGNGGASKAKAGGATKAKAGGASKAKAGGASKAKASETGGTAKKAGASGGSKASSGGTGAAKRSTGGTKSSAKK